MKIIVCLLFNSFKIWDKTQKLIVYLIIILQQEVYIETQLVVPYPTTLNINYVNVLLISKLIKLFKAISYIQIRKRS